MAPPAQSGDRRKLRRTLPATGRGLPAAGPAGPGGSREKQKTRGRGNASDGDARARPARRDTSPRPHVGSAPAAFAGASSPVRGTRCRETDFGGFSVSRTLIEHGRVERGWLGVAGAEGFVEAPGSMRPRGTAALLALDHRTGDTGSVTVAPR